MDKIVVCYSQRISENQIKNLYKTAKVTPIKLITTIKNLMGAGQYSAKLIWRVSCEEGKITIAGLNLLKEHS